MAKLGVEPAKRRLQGEEHPRRGDHAGSQRVASDRAGVEAGRIIGGGSRPARPTRSQAGRGRNDQAQVKIPLVPVADAHSKTPGCGGQPPLPSSRHAPSSAAARCRPYADRAALGDVEWGWIVAAILFGWIRDAGRAGDEQRRRHRGVQSATPASIRTRGMPAPSRRSCRSSPRPESTGQVARRVLARRDDRLSRRRLQPDQQGDAGARSRREPDHAQSRRKLATAACRR